MRNSDGCILPAMPRTKLVRASGGDGGGKAADRREGEQRHTPRAQNRNRHVTEAVNLRIVGVQNRDHVRPSIGARCVMWRRAQKAALNGHEAVILRHITRRQQRAINGRRRGQARPVAG